MPWVNGRFYANPLYGRALERARELDEGETSSGSKVSKVASNEGDANAHWVTINGHHVLIQQAAKGSQNQTQNGPSSTPKAHGTIQLSARDKAYLDAYYDAVSKLSKDYDIDPALVLGVGIESGFGSAGTYLRTGDAFGMTGGSTKHMTTASSPEENVQQFFDNYGRQIRGVGSDTTAFVNALEGLDATGKPVKGWKVYNSDRASEWRVMIGEGIRQMQRDIPTYESQKKKGQ